MSVEALLLCSTSQLTAFRPVLRAQGLRLYEAESFQDAKDLVQRHHLRLALTTESPIHTQLKALPQLDLVLLGRDDPETARRQLRAGVADWLSLPLRASDVQRMLSFHRRRQDSGQSTELLSASVLVDALNRALKTQASEQVLLQIVRAGRVLTRDAASDALGHGQDRPGCTAPAHVERATGRDPGQRERHRAARPPPGRRLQRHPGQPGQRLIHRASPPHCGLGRRPGRADLDDREQPTDSAQPAPRGVLRAPAPRREIPPKSWPFV